MKNHLLLPVLLLAQSLAGQSQSDYQPLTAKPADSTAVQVLLETRFKKDAAKLPKQNRDELETVYKERFERVSQNVQEGHYLFDADLTAYFNNILAEITRNNPSIPANEVRLFISRDPSPNASCLGEGTLVLNIGLIRRLENESQVAFVLCHELAHYTGNHVNTAIRKRVNKLNSKQTQKELKNISKSEYGKNQRAMELLKGIVFSDRRHSRLFESEADSVAFVYLKNTAYDEREAVRCLALLDEVDQEKYPGIPDLKKAFDTPEYPFKESWLTEETTLFGGVSQRKSEWQEDSLKTHPDCRQRTASMEKKNFGAGKKKFVQPEEQFRRFVEAADFEVVESHWFAENLGACLYQALLLSEKHPENAYLHATVGRCLAKMHEAQKNHELGKYVEQPSGNMDAPYRKVVSFIQRLRIKEMANINWFYLKNRQERYVANEEFLYALVQASVAVNNEIEKSNLKKSYLDQFPKGKYVQEVRKF